MWDWDRSVTLKFSTRLYSMKKQIIVLLVLLLVCSFMKAQDLGHGEVVKTNIASGELGIGQELVMDKISVEFKKVISDSRCPEQVNCIWQGEAKVLLGITMNGTYFEKELVISGAAKQAVHFGLLELSVPYLKPYPRTAQGISLKDYCLGVNVVTNPQ